ncbi:hypothetical protein KEM52_005142, partial [Ascosphaera acerosa]
MDSAGLLEQARLQQQEEAEASGRGDGIDTVKSAIPVLGMTLDQRAVALATAVAIDFDYFSRHSRASGGGGGILPFPIP